MIGEGKRDEVIGHILRVTDQKMSYSEIESIIDCYDKYKRSQPFAFYDVYEEDIGRVAFEDGRLLIEVSENELYSFPPVDIVNVFVDSIRTHGSIKDFCDKLNENDKGNIKTNMSVR